ncbi:MAG TPA: type II toxin-antitoxin system VapC family toxin [Candidatus Binataceae bacterium]|nr:type II toxin-antitoxin system VapC family toxin [Candidatus Binataceae bacterium]
MDTSALVAVLFREPEASLYARLIHDADRCLISAGSYLELTIVIERQADPETGRQCDMFFRRAGIVIEPFTVEQAHIACQAFHDFGKGRHAAALNFGDCFAYALAKITGEPLLFKGQDFRKTDVEAAA